MTSLNNSSAILPSYTQNSGECAFINTDNFRIMYSDKKYFSIAGQKIELMSDIVLECTCEAVSDKEASSVIDRSIKKISSNPLENVVKLKSYSSH